MKKIIIFCVAILALTSCKDHLADLNKNVINPTEVPAGSLFANATIGLFDYMVSTNVNTNNFRLWAQQWAQTTYADESNYILTERNVNGRTFITLYTTVLRDLADAKAFINADELISDENKKNQLAMIEVIEIFTWTVLVDIFGDVPYFQALDGDQLNPAYDNDADIYADLVKRLDVAISSLSGASGMGSDDLIYSGNTAQWKRFGNSLKLRMAIRMADGNASKAKTMAEQAISSGVFSSSSDDFELAYQTAPPHTNPLWVDLVQSGRSDFVAASTLVDFMNDRNDPRAPFFFKNAIYDSVTMTTNFVGGVAGDNNSFNQLSQPGDIIRDQTFPGTIMDYTEVEFLLADAAARGFSGAGSAADHYNAGITSSILEWGGTAQMATDYLAQTSVAYTTATGTWKEKIVLQKWAALYNRGFEAWSSYRMYDIDFLPDAAQAQIPPPRRFTYPVTEASLNKANLEAAVSAIGGDNLSTKVFWDVP